MCCHKGNGAKQILTAIREIDSTITEADSTFWHKTLKSENGGTAKIDPKEAVETIESTWATALSRAENWSNLTPVERLARQEAFQTLRNNVSSGETAITRNQQMKLQNYRNLTESAGSEGWINEIQDLERPGNRPHRTDWETPF